MSDQWVPWIIKAVVAAGIVYGIGILTVGLPGAVFLSILNPKVHPDAAWPLAIMITQAGSLLIIPASLLLRVIKPEFVGRAHVLATAVLTFFATLIATMILASQAPGRPPVKAHGISPALVAWAARPPAYFIVGMTNSAPSLTPEGHRDVTVFVLV
jgi:hypothetical protein